MSFQFINPDDFGAPKGYSNGVLTEAGGRLLFVAGQIGWDSNQRITSDNIAEQFKRALQNVITVVTQAGGRPDQIARMMIYVTDRNAYIEYRGAIGEHYRALMGKHFPAMVLVEVKGLLDKHAKVEIEAIAVIDP